MSSIRNDEDLRWLAVQIKQWGLELGFQQVGIADTDLEQAERHLQAWLDDDFHGEMDYMHRHGLKRSRPALLQPGTVRIISVRMDYLPEPSDAMHKALAGPVEAYISRYALGRDYHKLIRSRLQKLADKIQVETGPFGYRAFVDSAPVLEKALAEKAGLGWIGKHSNLINRKAGSWFFLGADPGKTQPERQRKDLPGTYGQLARKLNSTTILIACRAFYEGGRAGQFFPLC